MTDSRRPGMLGRAVAIRGRTAGGDASLRREGDHWEFESPEENSSVGLADVLALVGSRRFEPRVVDVVPELSGILFQEAVHQAETALNSLIATQTHIDELVEAEGDDTVMPFVLATSGLDRVVRSSMASVVLAIAATEAQLNTWGAAGTGWDDQEDNLSPIEKCVSLAERSGESIDLGRQPYQSLKTAVRRRNLLVHSRPIAEALPATGTRAWSPGRTIAHEARQTCHSVRLCLIDLADRTAVDRPSFLAYAPATGPDDVEAWRTASVMTGTRADPDFPPGFMPPATPDQ